MDNDLGGTLSAEDDEDAIRLTAYFLWEQDGRPEGHQDEYWLRAREQHARQKAYDGLLQNNEPDGGNDEPSDPT